MLSIFIVALNFTCPECNVGSGTECIGGKLHVPRLHLAANDPVILKAAAYSIVNLPTPKHEWSRGALDKAKSL